MKTYAEFRVGDEFVTAGRTLNCIRQLQVCTAEEALATTRSG